MSRYFRNCWHIFFWQCKWHWTKSENWFKRLCEYLEGYVKRKLRQIGIDHNNLYFQQDGATAHPAQNSMAVVRQIFGTVISHFGKIACPSLSSNLSVPDFFLQVIMNSSQPFVTKLQPFKIMWPTEVCVRQLQEPLAAM